MTRIVYLISTIKKDGPNKVLKSMIDGIDKNKYEVSIISLLQNNDKELIDYYSRLNIKVYMFNLKNKIDILFKGKRILKKWCKKYNPNLIHSHGILPDIINSKLKIAKIKKYTTIHNNMFQDYIYRFGKIKAYFFINWHLIYLKRMNSCVCCSKYVYDCMKRKLKNLSFVQNAIYKKNFDNEKYEEMRYTIRNNRKIKKEDIVYLYSGVLTERKNVQQLIKEFEKNLKNNEYLFVLGDGPLRKKLKDNCKCKNIFFLGFIDNVFDYYSASDVYVSFSQSEGFSISILEALEYNNYLLLSNIPSHKEIFEINKNLYLGELFNENNFNLKKELLRQKIVYSKQENIKKLLEEHLNCYLMMEQYNSIYTST